MSRAISRSRAAILSGYHTLCAALILFSAANTWAQTPAVLNSPAGGPLPSGITNVGGIAIDLVGLNGQRVVGEISAGYLYVGWSKDTTDIGTATGFTPAIVSALGGGIAKAAFRVSLYDGDSASGDFDYKMNTLSVNGVSLGNFSTIPTVETDPTGTQILSTNNAGGFRNEKFDTGFFPLVDTTSLATLFTSLQTVGTLDFVFSDQTPGDNYLDFTQGLAGNLGLVGHLPGVGNTTQVVQNSLPIGTPATIDYLAQGVTITGSGNENNTINSVDFTPGSSFVISGTLTVTSGYIHSQASGTSYSYISGGTLTGTSGWTFDNAGDQIVSATIAGSGGLMKTGSATLILSSSNTYTGTTTVAQGVLQIGSGTGGSINNSSLIIVNANTTLAYNMADGDVNTVPIINDGMIQEIGKNTNTFSGNITGSGSLAQNGQGTLILTGSNTYTGSTTVNSGILQISGSVGSIANTSQITIQQGGTLIVDSGASNTWSNAITDNGTVVVKATPFNTYTLAAVISGSGNLIKSGTNTLIVSRVQTYTGQTLVTGGTLRVQNNNTLSQSSLLQVDAGATVDFGNYSQTINNLTGGGTISTGTGTLTIATNDIDSTFSGVISGSSSLQITGAGSLTLTGSNTYTGATRVKGGVLCIGDGVSGSIERTSGITVDAPAFLAVSLTNNAVLSRNISNSGAVLTDNGIISGIISGTGSLEQCGTGTMILTGSNTYTGPTIVSSGVLKIGDGTNGTVAAGSALVTQSGGTLVLDSKDNSLLSRSISNDGAFELAESAFSSYTYTGTITGSGDFIKSGINTLTLDGSNSYGGATIVTGGTLRLASVSAIPAQSALQVISGATLDLSTVSLSAGSLSGDGQVITGSNTVTTLGSDNSNTTFSGAISGSGTVQKVGSGVWTVAGNNTYTGSTRLLGGTMLVNGSLQSDVFVMNGIFGGNGIIHGNVINQAMVSPGNSPGILTITGNYSQLPTASLLIQIASATSYDQLVIGGTASLGGTLLVSNLGNSSLREHVYTIVNAAGGVVGTFSDISSALQMRLLVIYGPNSVILKSKIPVFNNTPGLTANQAAVATALDNTINTSGFYSNKPLLKIADSLSDFAIQDIPGALERIVPTDYIILPDASFAMAQVQASNLEQRMEEIRGTLVDYTANINTPSTFYVSSANTRGCDMRYIDANGRELAPPPIERHLGFFLNGSGEFVNDKSSLIDGNAKFNTAGISTGADYRFNDNFAAGLTAGYANTTTHGRGDGSVGIDSGDLSAYATLFNEGYFVNGILGGASTNYTAKRESLDGMTRGDTTGSSFHALLGTGYTYYCSGLRAGPIASLRYTSVKIDGFSEAGSLAPLDIASQDKSSLKSTFGFQVAYAIPAGSFIIKPQARAQWLHEYGNRSRDIDASLQGGSSFTVTGPSLGSDSLLLDLGTTVQFTPAFAIYACYSGEIGSSNYSSNSIISGVQLSF